MKNFWRNDLEINAELEQVKEIMKNTIGHSDEFVCNPIFEMIDSGGKMLRSSMLILSSKFGEYDAEKVLPSAAGIELLHTATLIHDDIIDNSKIRRGIETIQSQFGKDAAVYSGDYIIARSLMLINTQYDLQMIQNFSKKMAYICLGELKQYKLRYNSNISIYDYIKIAAGKTASLFAISMYLGARLGELDEKNARLFALTGLRTGIAFQIIDDCLDYSGTDALILKNSRNDLRQGFYTLPLICALKNDTKKKSLKSLLDSTRFTDDDILRICNLVIEKNGIKDAKEYARRYTEKAFEALKRLPQCESRKMLNKLFGNLLERQY